MPWRSLFEDEELTYRELNARASQIRRPRHFAGHREIGSRGACVGICAERSVEMVVGLLRHFSKPERRIPVPLDLGLSTRLRTGIHARRFASAGAGERSHRCGTDLKHLRLQV